MINLLRSLKKQYRKQILAGSRFYNLMNKLYQILLIHFRPLNVHYRQWIRHFDGLTKQGIDEAMCLSLIQSMADQPKISVIMPVFNPSLTFLDEAIQSVRDQVYENWELCIADDASTLLGVHELILKHALEDSRIHYIFRDKNGHISAASNSALDLATGDFVALLDHDDLLHPLALFEAARVIQHYPDVEIIYSDEDKITKHGKRFNPYFKPDFDPELLLNHNMVSHLGIYNLDTIRKVGGFRLGLEGSQDYDILLRVLEQIRLDQVHHIPKVLYHWRATNQSVAENINIKPYAINAGERALNDHLERMHITGHVSYNPNFTGYQVEYDLPTPYPLIELIIFDRFGSINHENIVSLLNGTRYGSFMVTIALPAEEINPGLEELSDNPQVSIRMIPSEVNAFQVLNEIVFASDADFICALDGDLGGFSPGWLETLMGQVIQEGIGVVGPKLLDWRGRVFSNGIILGAGKTTTHLFRGRSADYLGYFGWGQLQRGYTVISGSCVLVSRENFLAIGGLNEVLLTEEYAWLDFCLRLKAFGRRNVLCPSVRLRFSEERDDQADDNQTQSDRNEILDKWGATIVHDPAFNPNLTLKKGNIRINFSVQGVGLPEADG